MIPSSITQFIQPPIRIDADTLGLTLKIKTQAATVIARRVDGVWQSPLHLWRNLDVQAIEWLINTLEYLPTDPVEAVQAFNKALEEGREAPAAAPTPQPLPKSLRQIFRDQVRSGRVGMTYTLSVGTTVALRLNSGWIVDSEFFGSLDPDAQQWMQAEVAKLPSDPHEACRAFNEAIRVAFCEAIWGTSEPQAPKIEASPLPTSVLQHIQPPFRPGIAQTVESQSGSAVLLWDGHAWQIPL